MLTLMNIRSNCVTVGTDSLVGVNVNGKPELPYGSTKRPRKRFLEPRIIIGSPPSPISDVSVLLLSVLLLPGNSFDAMDNQVPIAVVDTASVEHTIKQEFQTSSMTN